MVEFLMSLTEEDLLVILFSLVIAYVIIISLLILIKLFASLIYKFFT